MKLRYTFVINQVAGQMVAVPVDCPKGEQSIIKTNETGAYILELLKNDISKEEILSKINMDFEIENQDKLKAWLCDFLQKLKDAEVLTDD